MAALAKLRIVLVVGVLVAASGCTRDRPTSSPEPAAAALAARQLVAVDGSALVGPGGTLAPGVRVQPGSALVAQAFPVSDIPNGSDAYQGAWQAVLVVDGDPVDVWNRYVDALGLDASATAARSCVVGRLAVVRSPSGRTRVLRRRARYLTEPAQPDEDRIDCRAATGRVDLRLSVGTFTCYDNPAPPCPHGPVAHLYIRVGRDDPQFDGSSGFGELASEQGVARQAPPPPGAIHRPHLHLTGGSPLPRAGQPLDANLDGYLSFAPARRGSKVLHVPIDILPSGTRSLVTPAMLLACNSGLVAVVHDQRGPQAVAARFGRFDDSTYPLNTGHGRFRGHAWNSVQDESAGGYGMEITAIASPKGGSDLLITECGD